MFVLAEVGEPVPREKSWVPAEPPSPGRPRGAGLPCGEHVEREMLGWLRAAQQ